MEYKKSSARILRNENVTLEFNDLNPSGIVLTEGGTTDINNFFNKLFDKIVSENTLFEFVLEKSDSKDLFYDISVDIVNQLNSEIKSSESNFERIIELTQTR
ncbi:hypothetical protein PT156_05655 [Erysipelothrix rhusiopathiae]|nr:hypothetical protein [Erysipelothrix rhusiopathiae]MDE8059200.1 hypothetical protein [Erysipelothrix rhusiopathiae]MDE8067720.1 hypothetical protein [Erysipelothrix rhusiopathiae]MDE8077801.1 hypothetical protein [Erysipelothrix rhusiopathiae]MDE8082898.1 hypothetical protein [Erysipelothrix rhusiopathiae]